MNRTVYADEDKNAIRFSRVIKLEAETPFTGFGIKYVASGEENYFINRKKFTVRKGEYIIGNDFTKTIVQIDHKDPAEGICIDISAKIISEVAEYHDLNGKELEEFLLSGQFFVNRYNVKNTCLGYTLGEINKFMKTGTSTLSLLHNELFYSLAESIVTDQRFIFDHLRKMDFKKNVTNEEIFRSLLAAQEFIDEHILDNFSLEQLSKQAGISKYHFIRVFKHVFGVSPYQYQKRKRLVEARNLINQGLTIQETAILLGYADVPTFSKAFKQHFGRAPSHLIK
ncbi:MAG: helix-turn-helix domain-containing protein [Bacteroidota bacterium]|jgi:AraC family transcriptional regulator